MMIGPPHLYRRRALERDLDPSTVQAVIEQDTASERRGLTPILTLGHLAHLTGVKYPYLRKVVARETDPYHVFEIRRRGGGEGRVISSPDPTLMHVQRWLLARVLHRVPTHPASLAYKPGCSIRACAERHLGAHWLLKVDIHNFFHSIDERQVYQIFRGLGYTSLLALELARLCTRRSVPGFPRGRRFNTLRQRDRRITDYAVDRIGYLPQGAPTSGAIANLVARPLDDALTEIADDLQLVYTRYADDMVFSSSAQFDRRQAARIHQRVRRAAHDAGFELHERKTRIVPPGARHIVLGLLVDGDRVRLPRETRSRVATHVYAAERYGLVQHQIHRGFASILGMVQYVDGLLAFAHDIEPTWASPLWARWRSLVVTQAPAIAPFHPTISP